MALHYNKASLGEELLALSLIIGIVTVGILAIILSLLSR
jgi:hypothetical protein